VACGHRPLTFSKIGVLYTHIRLEGFFLKPSLMSQLVKYIKATSAELRQVAWPSKEQAITYTVLVIIISAIVALYVGAFDYLFSQGINSLIHTF
jgi:preprotein translocase subunit SecE